MKVCSFMFVFVLPGLREAYVSDSSLLSLWMQRSTFNGSNLLRAPGLSSTWKPERVIRSSDLAARSLVNVLRWHRGESHDRNI